MKKITLVELISHIISIVFIYVCRKQAGIFIVKYVTTAGEINNASTADAIDAIVKAATGNFILYVGLNFLLCTLIEAVACFLYSFQDRMNSKMLLAKIALAVLPTVILVIYILIWMNLK